MGIANTLRLKVAKAKQKGLGQTVEDIASATVEGVKQVSRTVKEEVDARGGLVETVKDGYEVVAGAVKTGKDMVITDGKWDAEKGQSIYERARNRALNAGRDVMDYAGEHGKTALGKLRDQVELQKDEYNALFVSEDELKTTYEGVGSLLIDGKVMSSDMIRPEFDAVLAFETQARESLEPVKGRPYSAQIREDIRAGAITSSEALLDMYQSHPDFVDAVGTDKKIAFVESHLGSIDDKV